MGKYNKGILGAFSGKVGPVVGASWRGKEIVRSLPKKTTRAASDSQVAQRLKFTTVTNFLNPLYPILSRYYGSNTGDLTRLNLAMSYHMKEAMEFQDPLYRMKYNMVQIAKGDLLGIQGGTVASSSANTLSFSWINNAGQGEAMATDKLVVAVYEPTTKTMLHALAVADRSTQSGNLLVNSSFSGLNCEVWATFASANEKKYATSIYMGSVQIA